MTAEMVRQSKVGVVLPISLLDKAEAGIRDTLSPSPGDNPLVTTFADRMKHAPGLDAAGQAVLLHQAADAVAQRIYPAYRSA